MKPIDYRFKQSLYSIRKYIKHTYMDVQFVILQTSFRIFINFSKFISSYNNFEQLFSFSDKLSNCANSMSGLNEKHIYRIQTCLSELHHLTIYITTKKHAFGGVRVI